MMVGTIGATLEERQRFWKAAAETERDPIRPRLVVNPDAAPDFWTAVTTYQGAGKPTAEFLLALHAHGKRPAIEMDSHSIDSIIEWAREMPGYPSGKRAPRPVSRLAGHEGRLQTRLIVELPYELPAWRRRAIIEIFCAEMLGARNLPYWAVLHEPGPGSDHRNFHAHIVFYERPAQRMMHEGQEVWDFEVKIPYRNKRGGTYKSKNGTPRMTRPYIQKKDREIHAMDFPWKMRCRFSEIVNVHLEEAGLDKRYDPRSYKEMGIEIAPTRHLGPRDAALNRQGTPREDARFNARAEVARRDSLPFPAEEKDSDPLSLFSEIERLIGQVKSPDTSLFAKRLLEIQQAVLPMLCEENQLSDRLHAIGLSISLRLGRPVSARGWARTELQRIDDNPMAHEDRRPVVEGRFREADTFFKMGREAILSEVKDLVAEREKVRGKISSQMTLVLDLVAEITEAAGQEKAGGPQRPISMPPLYRLPPPTGRWFQARTRWRSLLPPSSAPDRSRPRHCGARRWFRMRSPTDIKDTSRWPNIRHPRAPPNRRPANLPRRVTRPPGRDPRYRPRRRLLRRRPGRRNLPPRPPRQLESSRPPSRPPNRKAVKRPGWTRPRPRGKRREPDRSLRAPPNRRRANLPCPVASPPGRNPHRPRRSLLRRPPSRKKADLHRRSNRLHSLPP